MEVTKRYKSRRFGAMEVTKPYKFIGFGAMEITKPYKFTGFGAMGSCGWHVSAKANRSFIDKV